ncbi:SDH family Clp fold serine proteinase [Desulfovibrio subterraneus]|uniref:Serine dehydrogenase proteinase n=1 Tax=Desulfovibrio subterraneus TaxID=2718620 RepID=A0A7J0BJ52_9BACT|nr:peptidase [Desulfovibrio subterraneus]GFM33271.1 hypothetical protein DSM101010T_16360 [Desulfovibrio subterraneus]
MSYLHEYLDKMQKDHLGILDLQQELSKQLEEINKIWECYSFVYASALTKDVPTLSMNSDDFHVIHDMMAGDKPKRVLVYLQTPGGCGQTAERIAKFLHERFEEVHFLIAGDAMSAGTILALSGHEILMSDGGSLGPIDAQMRIGRSWCSAHDYITWMETLRTKVQQEGGVHPVDGTILAQISPGEVRGVHTALSFAIDRVERWLTQYKFRDWSTTEGRRLPVDEDMRKARAREIANELTNQEKWRSHGTRLTISDLRELGLQIHRVEDHPELAEPVARVKALLWVIFSNSTIFKMYADSEKRINRQASVAHQDVNPRNAELLEMDVQCQRCNAHHKFIARFTDNEATRKAIEQKGTQLFPKDNKLTCSCGFVIDLTGQRAHIENMVGKKILDDLQAGGAHGTS